MYQFLMGLDAEFYVIKTQILATKPISTLGNAYHLVAEDERQRLALNDKRAQPETASYIINRLPSKVIKNKTPYEIVWHQKPQFDHMRVFGCLAYYKNTNTKGDKVEKRGKPGVFLGYPQGTKGYKIYDIESKKIIIS